MGKFTGILVLLRSCRFSFVSCSLLLILYPSIESSDDHDRYLMSFVVEPRASSARCRRLYHHYKQSCTVNEYSECSKFYSVKFIVVHRPICKIISTNLI
mgnify:CR=1 FL=1